MDIIFKKESYSIMGACFEVYKEQGAGFLEAVYQECLELELSMREITYSAHRPLKLKYKKRILVQNYIPDFICYDSIILEIKAVKNISDEHRAQTINYLKATGMKLAILANFGHYPKLEYQRFVNQNSHSRFSKQIP